MNGVSSLLVLGGARSGKSAFAQAEAEASGLELVFIATAQAFDDEMQMRIADHAAARGTTWRTIEAPFDLAAVLAKEARPGRLLLVDCLTLWLSNVMLHAEDVDAASVELAACIGALAGAVILVSNEVGAGIVPDNALARHFRDAQGRLNQAMARVCQAVVLVTAGLPMALKPAPRPVIHLRV